MTTDKPTYVTGKHNTIDPAWSQASTKPNDGSHGIPPTYIIGADLNRINGGNGCVWNLICGGSCNTIESTAHHSIILFGKGITVSEPYQLAFGLFGRVWRFKMQHWQWAVICPAVRRGASIYYRLKGEK